MNDYVEELLELNWEMDDKDYLDAVNTDMDSEDFIDECEAF